MSEEITHQFPPDESQAIVARLDSHDAGIEELKKRMTTLEDNVERRLMDTRPIWEQVLLRLDAIDGQFNARFDQVDNRLEAVETRLGKVEREVYHLGKKFRVFHEEILDIQNKHEDLEERVDKLEEEPN